MKTVWEQILARYGQDLTMEPGGQTVQAFFQPLAEKSEQVPDEMTGIGWLDGRLWLYLGTMSLETGDTLRWQERRFQVRSWLRMLSSAVQPVPHRVNTSMPAHCDT